MRNDDDDTITLDTDVLEIFAAADKLRYNGKVFSRDLDDNWSGSWDNAVTVIENAA